MKSSVTVTLLVLLACILSFGQVIVLPGCPLAGACVVLADYDVSGYILYVARSAQKQSANPTCGNRGSTCIGRRDSKLTNIVVSSNVATVTCSTACGVALNWEVYVDGATVDTDLNRSPLTAQVPYVVATTPSSTTYTFPTVAVANGTYTDLDLRVSTFFPLTVLPNWTLIKYSYDGSHNFLGSKIAASCVGACLKWSDRASY